ncbi:MAG: pantetheine-phosphate adenylyltransferase [Rhodospirillales bacterium]
MAELGHVAVYPGTFDPITNGHLDIIRRATRVAGHLIVGVAVNDGKSPLFDLAERVEMVKQEVAKLTLHNGARVEVTPFEGLLVEFVRTQGADIIVRGLRAVSDFEYEFQMAGMNARIDPDVETVFLMASERHHFISSRFVKEICRLGGDVSQFVPQGVLNRLNALASNNPKG